MHAQYKRSSQTSGKMSGKEMFLKDKTLASSDAQFDDGEYDDYICFSQQDSDGLGLLLQSCAKYGHSYSTLLLGCHHLILHLY